VHIPCHVVAAKIDEFNFVTRVPGIADDGGLDAADTVAWELEMAEFVRIRPRRQADQGYTA
jgi:hypothetical protein